MEGRVSFEEEPTFVRAQTAAKSASSGLTALVVKWGFAKDAASAEKVLIGVFIVVLLITLAVCFSFLLPHSPKPAPPIPARTLVPPTS